MAVEDPFREFLEGGADLVVPASPEPTEPSAAAPAGDDSQSDEPDYQALIEEERQKRAELERRLADKEREYDARAQQLERLVGQQFQQARPAPVQQPQIEITGDEDPRVLAEKIEARAAAIAQQNLAAYNERVGQVMSGLVERGFRGELASVSGRKYFGDVSAELSRYFEQYPQEKLVPGRVEQVYNMLVGQNLETLEQRHTQQPELVPEPPPRRPAPSGGIKPVAPAPSPEKPVGPQLTAEQKKFQEKFRSVGVELSDEEFADIGRVFPKGVNI